MTENNLNPAEDLDIDAIIREFSEPDVTPEPVEVPESREAEAEPVAAVPEKIKEEPRRAEKSGASVVKSIGITVTALISIVLTALIVAGLFLTAGPNVGKTQGKAADVTIMDKFDMFMTNEISTALEGVVAIEKVYWLSDSDQVAPKPNEDGYGYTENPKDMEAVLKNARPLTGSKELLFNTDRPIWEAEGITYYYDETILVITWKEVVDQVVYTISEVVIAHASQLRRFLAGGEFGSDKQYATTEMADSVNAVVASSGDFYKFRRNGIVVYENTVQRFENRYIDTCYIDENGNLSFTRANELADEEAAQRFVDENGIRFSLCFGPVLIDDGVICSPESYLLGEIWGTYSRMALCQKGELHYLLVNATAEQTYSKRPTILEFARVVGSYGVDKAYALDGGQTTVIAMQGEPINKVDYSVQRQISDIIYFATALPDGE